MNIVLDTNVFISGIFFSGPPYQILKAWRDGEVQLVISPEILEEYQRVAEMLGEKSTGVDIGPILDLLTVEAKLVSAPSLPDPVCVDPDDDKFLACALASKTRLVISGDKHLLKTTGYQGIQVMRRQKFVDRYLKSKKGR